MNPFWPVWVIALCAILWVLVAIVFVALLFWPAKRPVVRIDPDEAHAWRTAQSEFRAKQLHRLMKGSK